MAGITSLCRHIAVFRQLLNVVYQAIQPPLTLNPGLTTQAESMEFFICANVGEYRFHYAYAMTGYLLTFGTIYPVLHPIGIGGFVFIEFIKPARRSG
jgi:hypothetical protein